MYNSSTQYMGLTFVATPVSAVYIFMAFSQLQCDMSQIFESIVLLEVSKAGRVDVSADKPQSSLTTS